jgi:chromosome segregation ATPase
MSCEKEAELSEEVLKQKTLLSLLQQQKDQREKELKSEITSLTQELKTLKTALKKTEFLLSEEKASFESEKHELILSYKMLQKDIKSSEAFSTFYTLRGDLQRAQETIASLESTLKMKDASLSQIDSQKNAKTSTSSETLSQIQKNFQDFYIRQKSSEDLHMSELLSKNEEISSLLNEIADLRHKILIFEKKKYENELVLVRADLHKAVAERSHAKRLLVAYVRSVQQLEKMLNRQVDLDDLENVFKEQVARLNEENKSLVEAKVKQGQFYEQEIKNLQEVIDGLHEKIQDYEMTVDSMRKIRVKENTEEIKSWIIKNKQLQELNKRIVEGFSLIDLNKSEGLIKKKMKDSVKIH